MDVNKGLFCLLLATALSSETDLKLLAAGQMCRLLPRVVSLSWVVRVKNASVKFGIDSVCDDETAQLDNIGWSNINVFFTLSFV
jgi:hypothetical protein